MTQPAGGQAEAQAGQPILVVRNLTRVFGEGSTRVLAVNHIDLSVQRGEFVLIMGPSGSGKTTLLTMIAGLLRPTEGTVEIAGREITAMSHSELTNVRRHSVGFVFQTFNLLESLSVSENVEVALNLAGASGRAARATAERILGELGMGRRLNFKPNALSAGEKQRVCIARALANDPELVLADEPTANLDSVNGREVLELLSGIAREKGRTVVVVSHDERISAFADRVLWLEDGSFKDRASP
ncbi:MAG TPA: ABC transporter ATP-binding protein [Phycisphaerae bacterium]|jgi:putative ABC transport system ATP-binding protein|nr:ABC transporter ATP-binding protein [Phycisphaerae bacterium]